MQRSRLRARCLLWDSVQETPRDRCFEQAQAKLEEQMGTAQRRLEDLEAGMKDAGSLSSCFLAAVAV